MANTYTDFVTGSIIAPVELSYASITLTSNLTLLWEAYTPPATVSGGQPVQTAAKLMDVFTSGATVYQISLPQGNFGSVGQTLEFTNRGSTPFVVTYSDATTSTTVGVGASIVFYLVDNSTVTGTWRTLQLGTGTSAADAAALAGAGLIPLGGRLNQQITVIEFSNTGIPIGESQRAVALVWRGGSGTLTLPPTSSLGPNWFCIIRNQGTGTLTLAPDDVTSSINLLQNTSLTVGQSCFLFLESAANRWFTVGNPSVAFSFTSATYSVDAVPVNTLDLTAGAPVIQRYIAPVGTRTQTLAITYPATPSLYTVINNTSASYALTFTIAGSTQIPITVNTNTQAFLSSDGISLYILSTQTIGAVQVNRGSAVSPTVTFLLDPSTGLYQPATSQLGVTVGGQNIMTFNGSDPANLFVISPATGIFDQIDGGLD